jgi:hypothetical protein
VAAEASIGKGRREPESLGAGVAQTRAQKQGPIRFAEIWLISMLMLIC